MPKNEITKHSLKSNFPDHEQDLKQLQDMVSFIKSNQALFKTQLNSNPNRVKEELNQDEQFVLDDLRHYRLTANMLLNRNKNGHRFSFLHAEALRYLVIHNRLTITVALNFIEGISSVQAAKIADGMDPREVNMQKSCWFKMPFKMTPR